MDLLLYPITVYADFDSVLRNLKIEIINPLINLLFALAIAFFLWGVFEFFLNQDNEEKKTAGKSHMLWGVIGITIMMGVFAILNTIMSTFGIEDIDVETGKVQLD